MSVDDLGKNITDAIKELLPKALRTATLNQWPDESNVNNERAQKYADDVDALFSESFGEALASIIDAYIRSQSLDMTITLPAIPVNIGSATTIPITLPFRALPSANLGAEQDQGITPMTVHIRFQ